MQIVEKQVKLAGTGNHGTIYGCGHFCGTLPTIKQWRRSLIIARSDGLFIYTYTVHSVVHLTLNKINAKVLQVGGGWFKMFVHHWPCWGDQMATMAAGCKSLTSSTGTLRSRPPPHGHCGSGPVSEHLMLREGAKDLYSAALRQTSKEVKNVSKSCHILVEHPNCSHLLLTWKWELILIPLVHLEKKKNRLLLTGPNWWHRITALTCHFWHFMISFMMLLKTRWCTRSAQLWCGPRLCRQWFNLQHYCWITVTAKSVDPSVHMMVQVCFCIQFAKIIPNTTGVFFFLNLMRLILTGSQTSDTVECKRNYRY